MVEVLVHEMTPLFESIKDGPNGIDHIVENNNLPRGALGVEGGRRVEELELFLEGGLARLCLAEE